MSSKNRTGLLSAIMLQFFWPFGGFLFTFNSAFKEQTRFIFILIAGFYGFTYVPSPESDMVRYLDEFKRLSQLDYVSIIFEVKAGEFSDYYTVILSYFVSFFTQNQQIYISIATIIFAFFYVGSIYLILDKYPISGSQYSKILLIILYLYVPIFFINGLRFYTAFYVFMYGLINVFLFDRKKFYLLIAVTPLIHISYIGAITIFFVFALFGKYRLVAYSILLTSFFTSLTSFNFAQLSGNNKAQEKIVSYTNVESISGFYEDLNYIKSQTNEKYKIFETISDYHFYVVLIVFLYIILFNKKIRIYFDEFNDKIINLNIYFLSLVFFTQNIPEGYRFKHIFVFLFMISISVVYNKAINNSNFKKLFLLISFGVIPYIISNVYLNLKIIPVDFYLSNWLVNYLFYN